MQKARARFVVMAIFIAPSFVAVAAQGAFDFKVASVSYDGCGYGSYDGTPDYVDQFVDLSNWTNPLGTATVSGGYLHLMSPGSLVETNGLSLDWTEVDQNPWNHLNQADGCRIEVTWAIDPNTDIYVGASFAQFLVGGGVPRDQLLLGILDFDATQASHIGISPGLNAFFAGTNTGVGGITFDSVQPLSLGDFTGDVIMTYDHQPGSTDFTGTISVDGGATAVLTHTRSFFVSSSTGSLVLYADPVEGSGPTPTPETCPEPSPTPVEPSICYVLEVDRTSAFAFSPSTMNLSDALANQTLTLTKPYMICRPASNDGSPVPSIGDRCCYKAKGGLRTKASLRVGGLITGQLFDLKALKVRLICEPCLVAPH